MTDTRLLWFTLHVVDPCVTKGFPCGTGLSAWVRLNTGIMADGFVLEKARKNTGLLHGTGYSMPKVQGCCLTSAGQLNSKDSHRSGALVFFIVD